MSYTGRRTGELFRKHLRSLKKSKYIEVGLSDAEINELVNLLDVQEVDVKSSKSILTKVINTTTKVEVTTTEHLTFGSGGVMNLNNHSFALGADLTTLGSNLILHSYGAYTLNIYGNTNVSGSNTGDVTLGSNSGLSLTGQVLKVGASTGLTASGNSLTVDQSFSPNWTGAHTFSNAVNLFGQTTAQHILPRYTDTFDLGSSTMLWRKGWLSEMDAVLFAQNTITLLGGWLLISKDEGALVADVAAADTQIDFGKTMTVNDFVLFRAALKVEYMKVGALVSGTTYNVTRNLDGSGANDWAGGTPFCVLGASGNGRVELNAYNTPRIQMLTQGATYNAQTELIRLGDLDGNWGYSTATYGLAIGEYASGKVNMTLDPTNSLRINTYATTQFSVTPNLLKFGSNVNAAGTTGIAIFGANQTYNSESVYEGDLLIGDNSASKANIFWDKSVGILGIRSGTDIYAAFHVDGIRIKQGSLETDIFEGINWTASNDIGSSILAYARAFKTDISEGTTRLQIYSCDNIKLKSEGIVIEAATLGISITGTIITPININTNSTTALLVEQQGVKDNVLVVNTTNARVGVNCAPAYPLEVYGNCRISNTTTADTNLILKRTDNARYTNIIFLPNGDLSASNFEWIIRMAANQNNLYFGNYNGTTTTYPLVLTSTGKVGIMDADPAEVLDVNGNINCTGVIKVDDVQVVSNRYIDSKINNNPGDTYDNPTKNLISCIKATLLAHGLVAAS